jgi:hypothetical protein
VARSFGVDPLDALSGEFRQAGRMKRVASRAAELHDTVFEVRVQGRRLVSTDQLVEAQWAARAAAQAGEGAEIVDRETGHIITAIRQGPLIFVWASQLSY